MFSYLEVVEKLVSKEIYGRGIKYYLEGKIVKKQELLLDFWRKYEIMDTRQVVYVKIPVLHLALNPEKYNDAHNALNQVVSCTCEYFSEYGVCKHVVAACAAMEQEFKQNKKQQAQTKSEDKKVDSLLENIFEVQTDKQTRRWLAATEAYIYSSTPGEPHWFDEAITETAKNQELYAEFLKGFKKIIEDALKVWEAELRLTNLIRQSLYYGGVFWWSFWKQVIPDLEPDNQSRLWGALWKMYIVGVFKEFQNDFLDTVCKLNDMQKQEIMDRLQKEFTNQTQIWTVFAVESRFTSWLQSHIDLFDPVTLIKLYPILPDSHDEVERRLYNQVKVWSDFLQSANYDDMVKTMNLWEQSIGRTDVYEIAHKYVVSSHPKKKKLLKELK